MIADIPILFVPWRLACPSATALEQHPKAPRTRRSHHRPQNRPSKTGTIFGQHFARQQLGPAAQYSGRGRVGAIPPLAESDSASGLAGSSPPGPRPALATGRCRCGRHG
ncbi:hypothetical protein EJ06DRAFT_534546 [Trichodelitschia bisporula]|uniref:Uncharacterized protein n=1 Tax=Trichodelitschia bisporula TaxID=703511 RepID=A0A6G1HIH4_9PEZI|nr:hypothetical protein EJ06DRAFT_534546 [Trichodelitschia bisporula]